MAVKYFVLIWLCIYSSGETRHNKILISYLNVTLKVKVYQSPKH